MAFLTEEDLEDMSIEWFKEIGYSFVPGPNRNVCLPSIDRGGLEPFV